MYEQIKKQMINKLVIMVLYPLYEIFEMYVKKNHIIIHAVIQRLQNTETTVRTNH